ncbi:LOW QUALITY PROTEIN: disrupted in schizophrenia 1 protein [Dugong dugon]
MLLAMQEEGGSPSSVALSPLPSVLCSCLRGQPGGEGRGRGGGAGGLEHTPAVSRQLEEAAGQRGRDMLGGGPPGAPGGWARRRERPGAGSHGAGSQNSIPPAASFLKKRLARRPGYMRAAAGPGIGFLPPAVGTPLHAQRAVCDEEHLHSGARARPCSLDSSQGRGLSQGSLTVPSGGQPGLAQSPRRGASWCFGIQSRASPTLPDRLTSPYSPGHMGCQREFLPMDSPEVPGLAHEKACDEGARSIWEQVDSNSHSLGSGPPASSAPPGSHDDFTSSFSFIRLSLSSAGERGEAEGCLPPREAESPRHIPTEMSTKAASPDRPQEDLWLLSQPLYPKAIQGLGECAWATGSNPRPGRETLSSLDGDSAPSCSLVSLVAGPSGSEGSIFGHAHGWDTLLRKYEPALRDCLLSNRKQLKIKSLRLKLQKLQDKAVEDDDYDKAEKLKQRLEDLEKEKSTLQFQLPSRQPELSSVLNQLGTQVQAALRWATHKANSEDTQPVLRIEPKLLEPTAQDRLHVSLTRRDWLLQEKQQLQKEIEALQVRMSVLEAKDEQLRREIDEQEQLLRWPGCELVTLAGTLPLGELREMGRALDDTLASANQVLLLVEPPEAIRSLQDRIRSLSLSLKEITAKVCMGERLCRTLRKKVSDIEAQLPALLEAKMLAISGSHFCTAKDLTEDIGSLASEREGLEGLLNKLLVLSSRNITKLESIKENYNKLKRELEHGETAYEKSVKEKTVKYMEMLEDKLHSCKNPLLEKVWEADLEACRLFIQNMQLKEARGSLSVEDEKLMGDLEGTAFTAAMAVPSRPLSEDGRKTPLQADDEWKSQQSPSLHCAGSEQKEESYILSEELGEKCEAIGKKLLYLEDQLHTAIHSHDEDLIHSLRRELQTVKETLQAMILQLQPGREAGETETQLPA